MRFRSRAGDLIAPIGATFREGGACACYIPSRDEVHLSAPRCLRVAVAYYATLAHGVTHWTAHASHCARDLKGCFGSENYAAEELLAELGPHSCAVEAQAADWIHARPPQAGVGEAA
ncbi:MAG: zincin-like metallopeptidase domain-containing protein [Azospirillaceae bacterium]|nr:zincin-like metallopeptidase domain-containing protein [Azospirillaceae bacterium]